MHLAIDVGIRAMGFAVWEYRKLQAPDYADVINVPHKIKDWNRAADFIVSELDRKLQRFSIIRKDIISLCCEWAEYRGSSHVGIAAAANDSYSILCFMNGIHKIQFETADFNFIPVSKWKGTLNKKIVKNRLKRVIGNSDLAGNKINSHAWDAVGIGLYNFGFKLDSKVFLRKGR